MHFDAYFEQMIRVTVIHVAASLWATHVTILAWKLHYLSSKVNQTWLSAVLTWILSDTKQHSFFFRHNIVLHIFPQLYTVYLVSLRSFKICDTTFGFNKDLVYQLVSPYGFRLYVDGAQLCLVSFHELVGKSTKYFLLSIIVLHWTKPKW